MTILETDADADADDMDDEPAFVPASREQLLYLLAEAAEIEHTLMCSYLYAAFSLKRAGEPGMTTPEAEAVARWRAAIMDVAVQEMGHLVLVANLTVALGGRPHFGRPNFPVSPGYFPAGVVVKLAGFSMDTLDHFIFLERPKGIDEADGREFVQDEYRREQRVAGLMPSAQDYETIGHLYEAIRHNIDELVERSGAANVFIGSGAAQVGVETMDLPGVVRIMDPATAHAAIDTIIDQGEGSNVDRDDSHYRAFKAIRDEFEALAAARPAFAPAWPVAANPVLRRPPDPAQKVYVERLPAATLLDFGCASYGLLMRLLVQCFGRSSSNVLAEQKLLMDAALKLMHVVAIVGNALARVPAGEADDLHAGMSFTTVRAVEPLVDGKAENFLLREQLARLARGVPAGDGLEALRNLDLGSLAARFDLAVAAE